MQIGGLARLTGCNIETIRYYERIGLMPPAARRGRYRSFGDSDVRRLRFVRRARELGFSLHDVRVLLDLSDDSVASCAQAREIAQFQLASARARIADLQKIEGALAAAVKACGEADSFDCPLLDVLAGGPFDTCVVDVIPPSPHAA